MSGKVPAAVCRLTVCVDAVELYPFGNGWESSSYVLDSCLKFQSVTQCFLAESFFYFDAGTNVLKAKFRTSSNNQGQTPLSDTSFYTVFWSYSRKWWWKLVATHLFIYSIVGGGAHSWACISFFVFLLPFVDKVFCTHCVIYSVIFDMQQSMQCALSSFFPFHYTCGTLSESKGSHCHAPYCI